jgi:hypothetical protein
VKKLGDPRGLKGQGSRYSSLGRYAQVSTPQIREPSVLGVWLILSMCHSDRGLSRPFHGGQGANGERGQAYHFQRCMED